MSTDLSKKLPININCPAYGIFPEIDIVLVYDSENFMFNIFKEGKKAGTVGERQVLRNIEQGFYIVQEKTFF